jgi:hypothetical protein
LRVHQLPVQPDQVQSQPTPKPADTARSRAAFEQMAALAMFERPESDRRQPQRERARPTPRKAGPAQQTAATASGAVTDRPAPATGIDLLI